MFMMKEMAIMDITVRDYGGGFSKTRLYIPFEDLPWDIETESFGPKRMNMSGTGGKKR